MIRFPIFLYFRYAGEDGNLDVLSDMQEELTFTLMKTFHVNVDQAARLLLELKQCVKRKNLITIYRCTGDRDKKIELDEVIMTALFKAQHLSPTEQLSLALAWNSLQSLVHMISENSKKNFDIIECYKLRKSKVNALFTFHNCLKSIL
jgi:hypothetical protein